MPNGSHLRAMKVGRIRHERAVSHVESLSRGRFGPTGVHPAPKGNSVADAGAIKIG